ncbi:hypothetical protein K456DRAFT_1208320 [Colletotrichum gloeosporioides 23]|nr:hypothetical protein K456DRAFT_1208320 [Colletotrichum gloeosporioides 23]
MCRVIVTSLESSAAQLQQLTRGREENPQHNIIVNNNQSPNVILHTDRKYHKSVRPLVSSTPSRQILTAEKEKRQGRVRKGKTLRTKQTPPRQREHMPSSPVSLSRLTKVDVRYHGLQCGQTHTPQTKPHPWPDESQYPSLRKQRNIPRAEKVFLAPPIPLRALCACSLAHNPIPVRSKKDPRQTSDHQGPESNTKKKRVKTL